MLVHRRVTPSMKWVERGAVRAKCLSQEHNTISPARARTRTARSGVERTNHVATAPPTKNLVNFRDILRYQVTDPLWPDLSGSISGSSPCIRLARGKFELTNQDSVGGKKSSVLTSSKQVRKGFEIRQLFSLKIALNIHQKGFTISKTIPVCKK